MKWMKSWIDWWRTCPECKYQAERWAIPTNRESIYFHEQLQYEQQRDRRRRMADIYPIKQVYETPRL